ncbi:MAG: Holliday junction branch migration protein RuvA [Candidatus Hydrogenedentales bacterium]
MFAFLRGIVAAKMPDHVHLDVQGVGYKVFVPHGTQRRLAIDHEVTLLTHCHIREDAFQIYGFARAEELALFQLVLSVQGVGPKLALSVLSALGPHEFARAVRESDVTAFTKISGVGKKTAQRLVLEIKAKLGQDAELDAILGEEPADAADGDDVIAALLSLGCTPAEAQRAAKTARKELGTDAPDEELLRLALRSLAKV